MKEFDFINKILLPLTSSKKHSSNKISPPYISIPQFDCFNLQDDTAKIALDARKDLIISKDLMIEDIHFFKEDGGFKIASKLLLSNLSDIASSGAVPFVYLLGFTKNPSLNSEFYTQFAKALSQINRDYKISLIGGDTSNSKSLHYSITIFGIIKKGKSLLRKNARDGDLIYVSNTIGDAFLGLNIKLKNISSTKINPKKLPNYQKKLLDKHYFPQPRIELSQELLKYNLSNCATDISDGLIADLSNICNASRLNAQIYLSQIPISSHAKKYLKDCQNLSALDLLTGGDDYELIFTINPQSRSKIIKLEQKLGIKLTCIGKFTSQSWHKNSFSKKFDVFLFKDDQNIDKENLINLTKKGYEHQ